MKKILLLLSFIALNKLICAQSFTANFTAVTGAIPASDVNLTCFPVTVSSVGVIDNTKGLSQVCLNITHTKPADIEVLMQAPDGTYVPLTIQNGGTGANYTNTCFSATATQSIKFGTAPFTGTYQPEGYLGAVNNGSNANGTWNICIRDRRDGSNASKGNINSATLTFSNTPAVPAPAPASCINTIPSSSTCASASQVCTFNGQCGSTIGGTTTAQTWTQLNTAACFGLDNNTFVKFIADSTAVTFNVWIPASTGATNGGLQMLFFSGTCGGAVTTYGCYPHIYQYFSPAKPLVTLITANGLIKGNTYYLLIDGLNGAGTDFSISAAAGIQTLEITPANPVICKGENTPLTASGGNGTYGWSPAGGLSATSGATVNASPTGTTIYTVTSSTPTGCPLTKDVTVTVNDAPTITQQPATAGENICQDAPVTILTVTATASSGTLQYQWYSNGSAVNTGGTLIPGATSSTYTPASSAAGIFYFYCVISISGSCPVTSDVSGALVVNPQIPQPVIDITQPGCSSPTATVSITSPLGSSLEYSNGGIYQSSPVFFNLKADTIYVISVRDNVSGCKSPDQSAVINALSGTPLPPVVNGPFSYCQNDAPSQLTANGTALKWYTAATGGTPAATAPTPLTNTPGSFTYYVSQTIAGCESARTAVVITVNALPIVTAPANQNICSGTSTTAINFSGAGAQLFTWTNNNTAIGLPASGTGNINAFTPVNNGTTPVTATITATPAASTSRAYISNGNSDNVSVINTLTNTVTATIPVGNNPLGVAVSPDGTKVYVTNKFDQTVSVINTATNTVTATIPVNFDPFSLAVSPDGTRVYVANPLANDVTIINAINNTVIGNVPVGNNPQQAAVNFDGSKVYITNAGSNNISVINTSDNTVTTIAAGINPYGIIFSKDGTKLFVTNLGGNTVSVIDTLSKTITATINVGTNPIDAALSPDGTKLYVSNQGSNNISVINTATNTVASTISVGASPAGISISGDGTQVYVANLNSDNVSVINTATNAVTNLIAVGDGPNGYGDFATSGSTCNGVPVSFTIIVNPIPAKPVVATAELTYCQNENAPDLTATGTSLLWYTTATGGTGVASLKPPTNAIGSIDYFVSQTIAGCESAREKITVTVSASVNAVTSFSYSAASACKNGTNPIITKAAGFTGGGTFSATPAGLSINVVSSDINLGASNAGNYTITYTIAASACTLGGSSQANFNVINNTTAGAGFVYLPAEVCANAPNALPATNTGFTPGGIYTALPAGLVINSSTGSIDVSASTVGSYTVTYTVATSGCVAGNAGTAAFKINAVTNPVTGFTYSPNTVCANAANPLLQPVAGFTSGGVYTASPAGLSINAATGAVDVSASIAGVYTITYTVAASGCAPLGSSNSSFTITANTTPVTGFNYTPNNVCTNGSNPTLNKNTGFTAGGTFTAAPAGLDINSVNGAIDIGASTVGNYLITYTLPGAGCRLEAIGTNNFSITQIPPPAITQITYNSPVCNNVSGNLVPLTGPGFTTGGTFSSSNGLSVNAATGLIDISLSTPGQYTVTYTIPATACTPVTTGTAPVEIIAAPPTPVVEAESICGEGIINMTVTNATGTIKWYTDEALTNLTNTGTSYSPFITVTTPYFVTATGTTCVSDASKFFAIINSSLEEPFAGNDTSICPGEKIVLNPGVFEKYEWQDGSEGNTFTVTQPGLYTVKVTTGGCSNTGSIIVAPSDDCTDIVFASAFSPESNSANKTFGALPLSRLGGVKNYTLIVYNRYGQIIFKTNDPYQRWDGTYKGKKTGTGNYVWYATYLLRNRFTKKQKGNVMVLR